MATVEELAEPHFRACNLAAPKSTCTITPFFNLNSHFSAMATIRACGLIHAPVLGDTLSGNEISRNRPRLWAG